MLNMVVELESVTFLSQMLMIGRILVLENTRRGLLMDLNQSAKKLVNQLLG